MHGRRLIVITAILVVMALGFTVAGCGTGDTAQVSLKHSFNSGDSWTYEISMVMNGSMAGPGMSESDEGAFPKDTTIKMRETVTVTDVVDGVATVTAKTEILETSAAGQPVDMGAESTQEVTMRLDETGKVLSIEGLDQAAMSGLFGSGVPFDVTQFSDQLGVVFPDGGMGKVGDEWSQTATFPMPGLGEDITATTKARLISVEMENGREIATIEYTVDVPMDLELDLGAMMQQFGAQMGTQETADLAFKMTMNGGMTFSGTAKVDTADGQTAAMNGLLDLTMNMQITEAPEEMVPASERGPFEIAIDSKIDMVQK